LENMFLGLKQTPPPVRHGFKNWDCLVIVIPPTVPRKASMVICTSTLWIVYRAVF
jgi:hypothetical protein